MDLSASLQKGILDTGVGSILNRFKLSSRRDSLFFEDIVAWYVEGCEDAGFENEMHEASRVSFEILVSRLVPAALRKMPVFSMNVFGAAIWKNLGLLDELRVSAEGPVVTVETQNESITRIIGENGYMAGGIEGVLDAVYGYRAQLVGARQTKERCTYVYEITGSRLPQVLTKDKDVYNRLNAMGQARGVGLREAVKGGIYNISDNKMRFRGRLIWPVESTFFHVLGNMNVCMDSVTNHSERYFSQVLKEDSPAEGRLTLLKTLIQTLGWGLADLAQKENGDIVLEIKSPPYGFQKEKDNWTFLYNTITGFLRTIDERYALERTEEGYKRIMLHYSIVR